MTFPRVGLLALLCALAACSGNIRAPEVYNRHTNAGISVVPVTKILFVFDISIEEPHLPRGGIAQSTDDFLQERFGVIFTKLNDWAQRQGVQVETRIHRGPAKLRVNIDAYSHIVVEKVTSEHYQSGGAGRVYNRNWVAEVVEVKPGPPRSTRLLHGEEYASDAIDCFTRSGISNRGECQAGYIQLLSGHLKRIDPGFQDLN